MSLGSEIGELPREVRNIVYASFDVYELAGAFIQSGSSIPNRQLWNQVFQDRFPEYYGALQNNPDLIDAWFQPTESGLNILLRQYLDGTDELYIILVMVGWINLNIVERLLTYPVKLIGGNLGLMVFIQLHDLDIYMFTHHLTDLFTRDLYVTVSFILDRLGDTAPQLMSAHDVFTALLVPRQPYMVRNKDVITEEVEVGLRLVNVYSADDPLNLMIGERSVLDRLMTDRTILAYNLFKQAPPGSIDYSYKRPDGSSYLLIASKERNHPFYTIILQQAPWLVNVPDASGHYTVEPINRRETRTIRSIRRR